MLKKAAPLLLSLLCLSTVAKAQFGFSHEVGVIAGPVALQSDYGERHDFKTNSGNTGYGIGIVHYLNFAYQSQCNCYAPETFFNDHIKLRTEISYSKTQLQQFGKYVDKDPTNNLGVQQLRGMRGSSGVFDIGAQVEYFPLSVRDFTSSIGSFAPFVSIGAHYVTYSTEAYSTLGPLGAPQTTFPKYLDPSDGRPHGYSTAGGNTWSIVSSVGTRYKISPLSDLMLDFRLQYYFSDWVDGLNPNPEKYKENKANDWLVFLNVGYVYYLNL